MVPLGAMASVREINGPVLIQRYNMYPSAPINGEPAPGVSSGEAIRLMAAAANQDLPRGMKTEWTELALLQIETGNTAMWVFLLAVVLVFLVLAAQYESWSLPLAVILVVPMCLLFSIAGVALARMDINIFTQVGFVVLVGLACKNAILIVEFAKIQHEAGQPRREATLAACKLRLRPIIMTSLAFIIGVIPLVLSAGRRGRDAADPGRGRLRRHVGRHPLRNLLDAGLLLRHRMAQPDVAAAAPRQRHPEPTRRGRAMK